MGRQPPRRGETPSERRIRESKIVFLLADRYLDSASQGPLDLKEPATAKIVEDSVLFGAAERYAMYAWCVMANHVHVLLTPRWELRKITQGMKGYTAHEINALSGQRGRHLWQDESFDHWARDEEELTRIIYYIENNPVAAGLCQRPEEWPWSSGRFRGDWPVGLAFEPDGK